MILTKFGRLKNINRAEATELVQAMVRDVMQYAG
jgi:hypothetical protein